jgi:phosphoribosylamine--glycine ligase
MLTTEGPKVLEYNCRMGDPECQPLMVRLESDLAEALEKLSAGKLTDVQLKWSAEASVCVVLASKGYPGSYETGKVITGIEGAEKLDGVNVFHAGTKRADGGLVTNGGRVLGVTARGKDRRAAVKRAYAAVEKIQFDGMHFRRDIGKK